MVDTRAPDDEHSAWIDVWRRILIGAHKSWVLFEHGTCVVLPPDDGGVDRVTSDEPERLMARACAILGTHGPVVANSSAAEFSVIPLADAPGWVVTGHHPDILNYIGPETFTCTAPPMMVIGMYGRTMRDADGREPRIVHIEDRRAPAMSASF